MNKPKYEVGDRFDSWIVFQIDNDTSIPVYRLLNIFSKAELKLDEAKLIKIFR